MNEQKNALYSLINNIKLTASEAANLTLGDLHLAGNEPTVKIWDEKTGQRRVIRLDEVTRNALVAWLLVRPDRPVTLLFPSEDDEGLSTEAIDGLLENFTPPPPSTSSPIPIVTARTIEDEKLPTVGPLPARQVPPPFKAEAPVHGPERVVVRKPPEPAPHPTPSSGPGVPEPKIKIPSASDESKTASVKKPQFSSKTSEPEKSALVRFRKPLMAIGSLILLACVGLVIAGSIYLPGQFATITDNVQTSTAFAETSVAAVAASNEAATLLPTATSTKISSPTPKTTNTATTLPTQPATETPTEASTDTPTPKATNTRTPRPTRTPTNTPLPTATNTPRPAPRPTATIAVNTATQGFKYEAPELLSPEVNKNFSPDQATVILRWEPIENLAEDEEYAVRLIYTHAGEIQYRGKNVKENYWEIPSELHNADGQEFLYIWYVQIEKKQEDDTVIFLSPESERRQFIWRW